MFRFGLILNSVIPRASRTLFATLAIAFVSLGSFAQGPQHPQQAIFGTQHDFIRAGRNPNAQLVLVNPHFMGKDFGSFRVPSAQGFLNPTDPESKQFLELFSMSTDFAENAPESQDYFVPPETGRALMLSPSAHAIYRDILVKGTGVVPKFTVANQLRLEHLGFDGYFEVSEAIRDMLIAEILHQAGVSVVRGLAVIDHGKLETRTGIRAPLRMGNYVRAFKVQTRLSNLEALRPPERKAAIDDAIQQLQKIFGIDASAPRMNYAEYFIFITKRLAKTAAIYQSIGFTQDSLHYGQVTLAGEMADLGVGSFNKPLKRGVMNTKYPWFRFERQPALLQNMLYRTHSVKSEPEPSLLPHTSKTVESQKSLFGYIKSFDPESAKEIERLNPSELFWNTYKEYYRATPAKDFQMMLVENFNQFFEWKPDPSTPEVVLRDYRRILNDRNTGIARERRWSVHELPSLAKMRIFAEAAQLHRQPPPLYPNGNEPKSTGPWNRILNPNAMIKASVANDSVDISWIPQNPSQFHENKFGSKHALERLVRRKETGSAVGSKILFPVNNLLSPFAVISEEHPKRDSFKVTFENPRTGEIQEQLVPRKSVRLINPEGGSKLPVGAEVAKIKVDAHSDLVKRTERLLEFWKNEAQSSNQRAFLLRFLADSYLPFYTSLPQNEQATYLNSMNERISGTESIPLEKIAQYGYGNCTDQSVYIASMLDRLKEEVQFDYAVYISKTSSGAKHWFIVITLKPTMEQLILDPTATAPRLMSIREANYHHWGAYGLISKAVSIQYSDLLNLSCNNALLPEHPPTLNDGL